MNSKRRLIGVVLTMGTALLLVSCFAEPSIALSSKKAFLPGMGLVLEITNASDKTIHRVTIEIAAPDGSRLPSMLVAKTMEPHTTEDFGPWELRSTEWKLEAGQTVVISCHGYRQEFIAGIPEPGT